MPFSALLPPHNHHNGLTYSSGGKQFRLTKTTGWDSVSMEQIEEAARPGRGAEIGAVVCGEGTAAICLMSENMTVVRQRIECPVPRKRSGTSSHDKVGRETIDDADASGDGKLPPDRVQRHSPLDTLRVAADDRAGLAGIHKGHCGWKLQHMLMTALRLHFPAGNTHEQQAPPRLALQMGQGALEHAARALIGRGTARSERDEDALRVEVCARRRCIGQVSCHTQSRA